MLQVMATEIVYPKPAPSDWCSLDTIAVATGHYIADHICARCHGTHHDETECSENTQQASLMLILPPDMHSLQAIGKHIERCITCMPIYNHTISLC